jgi:class 3 adenylate cyclase
MMGGKSVNKVPRFHGLRIYISSITLYYGLVLPFILILYIKYAPKFDEIKSTRFNQSGLPFDTLGVTKNGKSLTLPKTTSIIDISDSLLNDVAKKADKSADSMVNAVIKFSPGPGIQIQTDGTANDIGESKLISQAFNLLFNLLLISFFLGFLFNLPFKRYFTLRRKGKQISPKLFKFCKKYLLKSPLINSAILGLSFIIVHGIMFFNLYLGNSVTTELEKSRFVNFFYISLIASVLSLIFVYYWEKHRVHIRYIHHIFSEDELRKRIFNLKVGRIRNRMIMSAMVTTLLPLTIVILYLFLSITSLDELKILNYNEEQKRILFGDYSLFNDIFTNEQGVFEAPESMFYINAINSFVMFIGIYGSIFIVFIYIIFFVKWTTQDLVHPVKELLNNMRRTGQGELNNFGIVRTNDEIGELTEGYNDMSQKLGEYIHNISQMTEAYSRFVPKQFLDFLGKKSYVDIKLGDQVQKEMTVMFSDIRHFTEISEQMTPKENFDFINYYLGYMEPVIRNNNGFIDKYIGDSIMALFGMNAEDAINAAIEMRIKLSQFNQVMDQFNKPIIDSGIGIHSGSLMLGIVGGEGRMDSTVISDAVNLAARLEGLTKIYGSAIIISQDTLISLNNPSHYNYRFLDIVKVRGKSEAVYIFEIIDGDPDDIRQLKLQTKEAFTKAVNLYKAQQFNEAIKMFAEVFAINQHDRTAALYIKRCRNFIEKGVPVDWDGIETISWN